MTPADVFARLGGDLVDPPIVLPASLPLELSGEAVRARLCVFPGADGEEQALRPDLTLPVVMDEVARRKAGEMGERVVRYDARAFRLPATQGDPLEFTQTGFERFGAPSDADADARAFALVCVAAESAGVGKASARFGDLAVFPAFVDALGLANGMADALKRAFRQAGGVKALLEARPREAAHGLAARLRGATPAEAEAIVQDIFALAGIQPQGLRTLDEIVERLLQQAEESERGGVPDLVRQTLEAVMAVDCPPDRAADALLGIARQAGLDGLDDMLQRLSVRADMMAELVPGFVASARFGTPFGRRFNYYDGFLFELFSPEPADWMHPFGAGGRYDTVLSRLSGGDVDATAIGGVVRPDRLALVTGDRA